jgi:hypothetical protein
VASLAELPGTADAILAAFADQLETGKVEVPERRYVHSGIEPAWDGPQLTVGLIGIQQGQPGGQIIQSVNPRAVHFYGQWRVILLRTAPTLGDGPVMLPSETDLGDSGAEAMNDIAALVKAFSELHLGNVLTGAGEGMVLAACRPLGVQGGIAGSELVLEMTLR